jgi:phenylalanyl-tRNA synthetase beta chain
MKFTRSWIDEFVAIPASDPEALVEAFESMGHEVEDWHAIEPAFSDVVVGKVLEIEAHPNADKVRVTKVDVGTEVLEIICGAWNFEVGAIVPVAVPGSILGDDFEVTRREIRGITSNGMICSEIELGLGDEADGIMVLNVDYPTAADSIGEDFSTVIGLLDTYFEIEVTPNRPDCLSVYGLCRDLSALYQVPLRDYQIHVEEFGEPNDVTVTIEDPELCGRFAGRRVRDITVGPSPHPIRWRLTQAGIRPISNVVDASNYAMVEFGYPTHAFDVERLGTNISVRLASEGETIVTLDERERTLTSSDLVVTDGDVPVAIGGVMGGATTEVHDGTTDVFIEAAYWDPGTILVSSQRLGLRSEASKRFERGADPSFCALGADRVAQLLAVTAGGKPAPNPVDEDPASIVPWTIDFPLSETSRILGVSLDSATTTDLLTRMFFGVDGIDPLKVTVPTRRPDVQRPIDVVEEIARLHGFDSIPDSVPSGPGGGLPYEEQRFRTIREVMVGAGFYQTMTFSFIGSYDLDRLSLPEGHPIRSAIAVVNPLNETEGVMRTTLIPGLLKAAESALGRTSNEVRLFETGKVFLAGSKAIPDQPDRLGFVLAGDVEGRWDAKPSEFSVFDATGTWEVLSEALNLSASTLRQAASPMHHPGRCAEILVDGSVVGTVGELLPTVASAFGLDGRVVIGEIELSTLLADRGPWEYAVPSVFPPVVFDMAFVVDEAVPALSLVEVAAGAASDLLESVVVFDVFEGSSIADGKKSVALRFNLRAPDRTLAEDETGLILRTIAEAIAMGLGGELRGAV